MDITYNEYQRTSVVRSGDVEYHILWAWPELGEPHTVGLVWVRCPGGFMWEVD